jgi:hypothetical protein
VNRNERKPEAGAKQTGKSPNQGETLRDRSSCTAPLCIRLHLTTLLDTQQAGHAPDLALLLALPSHLYPRTSPAHSWPFTIFEGYQKTRNHSWGPQITPVMNWCCVHPRTACVLMLRLDCSSRYPFEAVRAPDLDSLSQVVTNKRQQGSSLKEDSFLVRVGAASS